MKFIYAANAYKFIRRPTKPTTSNSVPHFRVVDPIIQCFPQCFKFRFVYFQSVPATTRIIQMWLDVSLFWSFDTDYEQQSGKV